jgi:hypothetical protein
VHVSFISVAAAAGLARRREQRYEPTREAAMAAFREELAKGIEKSAFGGKPENIWSL